MEKIRFRNSDLIYDAKVVKESDHVVHIMLDEVVNKSVYTSGFDVINEYNQKVMCSYEDYITEYRLIDKRDIELSNDGSIYIPPEPTYTSVSVSIEWDDNDDEDKIRPAKISVNLYKDKSKISTAKLDKTNDWKHTFENLETGYDYTVLFEDVSGYERVELDMYNMIYQHTPLNTVKKQKITEINQACSQRIYDGCDIELSTGIIEHYRFTEHVQSNIVTAYNIASALLQIGENDTPIPFYNSDDVCEEYLSIDILNIYFAMGILITESVTLDHQLQDEINAMDDPDAINEMKYDLQDLDEDHRSEYDRFVQSAINIVEILKRRFQGGE